jgi:hypothetical protein
LKGELKRLLSETDSGEDEILKETPTPFPVKNQSSLKRAEDTVTAATALSNEDQASGLTQNQSLSQNCCLQQRKKRRR